MKQPIHFSELLKQYLADHDTLTAETFKKAFATAYMLEHIEGRRLPAEIKSAWLRQGEQIGATLLDSALSEIGNRVPVARTLARVFPERNAMLWHRLLTDHIYPPVRPQNVPLLYALGDDEEARPVIRHSFYGAITSFVAVAWLVCFFAMMDSLSPAALLAGWFGVYGALLVLGCHYYIRFVQEGLRFYPNQPILPKEDVWAISNGAAVAGYVWWLGLLPAAWPAMLLHEVAPNMLKPAK